MVRAIADGIHFITTEETLPLRNEILREGKLALSACRFDGDEAPGTFHLGYYQHGQLLVTGTFHEQARAGYPGKGYQLRGMATVAAYQGRGLGNKLVNFAVVYLRGQKAGYIWCNARKNAYRFYQNLGFEFISDEFEIAGIGPHRVMYLKIQ